MISTETVTGEMKSEAYECSMYADKRHATLENMYKTAWYLRTDEFRKSIGFVSPQEWRKKYRKEEYGVQYGPDDE